MKHNRCNLITALLDFMASICFVFAAALQTEMPPKILYGIAAACLLIGGTGFFVLTLKREKPMIRRQIGKRSLYRDI